MAERVLLSKALRAASKRLPLLGDRWLRGNLAVFTNDLAEAYKLGAEEAQTEIVARLRRLSTTKEKSQ